MGQEVLHPVIFPIFLNGAEECVGAITRVFFPHNSHQVIDSC